LNTGDETNEEGKGKGGCTYTYVDDSTKVSFTAYKYESKAGVGGSFKEQDVFTLKESGSVSDLLTGLEFRIPVSSSWTNNDDRDKKILEHFWGEFEKTEYITGEIVSVKGNDSKGKVSIKLIINAKENEVKGRYEVAESGHITLSTEVDMTDFDGLDAIAALNKVCEDLHREAPEQESKLWPNVSVSVKGYLKKNCD